MKVVIPVAGRATRMRPFTHTKIKALLPVAGKAVIDHILEPILALNPTEIYFVTGGPLKDQFELHIHDHYPDIPAKFVEQKNPKGPGHAIWQAKDAFDEPTLICYSDTIFKVDLDVLKTIKTNAIWAMEVEEWQRFGIVATDDASMITKIVEKPKEFVGNLANIGMYYVHDAPLFKKELEREVNECEKEIFPIDPFNRMIEGNSPFKALPVDGWFDTGTVAQTLVTNKQLLDKIKPTYTAPAGVTVVPPVSVDPTAQIESSTIGPYVTIGPHVVVKDSVVKNSIIDEHTLIEESKLTESQIGRHSIVAGKEGRFILGDHSQAFKHP